MPENGPMKHYLCRLRPPRPSFAADMNAADAAQETRISRH
jgi:hypothetical protein